MTAKKPFDLRTRTKQYALRIIKLYQALPRTPIARHIGGQLLRSGTSIGAHYREGHRARSTAEFISKIEVALQELDETTYWMELLIEAEIMPASKLTSLLDETNELIAIFVSSVHRAKQSQNR